MRNAELMAKARKVLNQGELKLFELMNGQYLVPFIKGAPGIGKSEILKSIATKLDMVYWDLRTVTMDETDAGLFPIPKDTTITINGKEIGVSELKKAAPEWAIAPLKDPNVNHLFAVEEINRASLAIRNAFMGVLLERRVGWAIQFGNNVFMAATGNLGDKDGTEVEELDFAQRDRFIIVEQKHDLNQWINDYAKDHVHPDIIKFLMAKPAEFYPSLDKQKEDDAVITPRKWTGFSNFIVSNTEKGLSSRVEEYIGLLDRSGLHFLGSRIAEFRKFVLEGRALTVEDVLKGTRKKEYLAKLPNGDPVFNRDNFAEVLTNLKDGVKLLNLNNKQSDNLKDFLDAIKVTDHDMLVGYVFDAMSQFSRETSEKETANKTELKKADLMKYPAVTMFRENFNKEMAYVSENNKHEVKGTK